MTELRKKVLAEIDALYVKDIDENLEKNLKLLYDYIKDEKNLKDDRDIRIFLYTNKDHAAIKPYSNLNTDDFTAINEIITGKEPNLIKEDIKLEEIFGETYAEPGVFENMKGKDIKTIANLKNKDFYEVLKAKEDDAVRRDREDIFWGTNLLQQIFTPRTYERRMRGETPDNYLGVDAKDLTLDAIENAAYTFLPGNILKYVAKIPQAIPAAIAKGASVAIDKVAKGSKGAKVIDKVDKGAKVINKGIGHAIDNPVTNFGAGAVTNPFMMEGLDALAYDDNESTDRKEFSLTDALIGSGINVGAPIAFRAPIGMVGELLGGSKIGPKIASAVAQLGKGKSISELSQEAADLGRKKRASNSSKSGLKKQQNRIKQAEEAVKEAKTLLDEVKIAKPNNKLEIDKAKGNLEFFEKELNDIKKPTSEFITALQAFDDKIGYNEYDPRLLDYVPELEKLDAAYKNYSWIKKPFRGSYANKAKLVDKALKTFDLDEIRKNEVRKELLDIIKDVKFDSDKAAEGYLLSYVTNKYGDVVYGDRASTLPIVGEGIKRLNEWELKGKRKKVRDEFSKMLLPEVKPNTTKGAK